ncbi:hypothetical protein AXF42_Ash008446 [Apostasia shenzhenica]|uniref:Trafficking protein particle complex subunit 11 domain-containing protein n=1 Tax=Apostasia shenzhenica TaxID=1088818 RepID=A0A2I0AXX8_9ASPA|nr:hypothetical protein AXF42_Ash008446 [Apostasia shenzhenica]
MQATNLPREDCDRSMEEYPEELRTPPISLVSLVGCPEHHSTISKFLHSEQPPINTLALPDFSKISIFSRKLKDPLDAGGHPPGGILKRDWLLKHRTRIPAVAAALFSAEQVTGDPAQWQQVCTDLDNIKVVRGRNMKFVVVLVQKNASDDLSEDHVNALRKRAELDSKHVIVFLQNDATELRQSLKRLAGLFAELCNTYYRDEGRRIKIRMERKNVGHAELIIRYCYKARSFCFSLFVPPFSFECQVAAYAEFRRDWIEALRYYEDAYNTNLEIIGITRRLPAMQRLTEIKAVAEQLHFKLSTLLLQGGKVTEAVAWFQKHVKNYKKLVGAPEVTFLHWEWFSRQYLVFAELLERNAEAIPDSHPSQVASSECCLIEWELQPAYYYGVLTFLTIICSLSDAEYARFVIAEGQRFQDLYEIIALFRRSSESFNSLHALRTAAYGNQRMAREYFSAGDWRNAKQLLEGVADLYRREGWVTLLWEALGYLRECSRNLGSLKDFVHCSIEMAALPIFSDSRLEAPDVKREYGPAGPPTLSQRETIQQEIFSVCKGHISDQSIELIKADDQPLILDIDLVSPLRMAFLTSVTFHNQTIKPGETTYITVSILSQLPHPVEIDQLEIQFNQSNCNFKIVSGEQEFYVVPKPETRDVRIESTPSLIVTNNNWLRMAFEIGSELLALWYTYILHGLGQSGKLECMSVIVMIGRHLTLCCRAESPASLEGLPLWKFENVMENFPTKDPVLSFSGQKYIQVEEPDPLVDLTLSAPSPALVGENFIVPVFVVSKGHAIHSAELKINLVDARGGGMLMSPRDTESFSLDSHHVELLSVSGVNDDSSTSSDDIRKIQQSFGVVSVPFIDIGQAWSCQLTIKWNSPKSIMLYVSLGYVPVPTETNFLRVNVHRSLQIEGKIPFTIAHRFMMPFRREPLLLTKIKASTPADQKMQLPVDETSILIVSARNCSEIPLRLISVSIEPGDNPVAECSCTIMQSGSASTGPVVIVPGEEFKQVFAVIPQVDSPNLDIGEILVKWVRVSDLKQNENSVVITKQFLPRVFVEKPLLVASLDCPAHAVLGVPFSFFVKVQNKTSLLQEIKYSVGDSQSFVFTGPHSNSSFILPKSELVISYKLVPVASGLQNLPSVSLISVRYSTRMDPSLAATAVFVYPADPRFHFGKNSKLLSASGELENLDFKLVQGVSD